MKLIVCFIMINFLVCYRFKNLNKTFNEECRLECFKLSRIFSCFCDSECINNKDCCTVIITSIILRRARPKVHAVLIILKIVFVIVNALIMGIVVVIIIDVR